MANKKCRKIRLRQPSQVVIEKIKASFYTKGCKFRMLLMLAVIQSSQTRKNYEKTNRIASHLFFILNASYAQETIISGTIKNLTANSLKCNLIPHSILEKPVAITIPLTEGKFTQNLSITKTTLLSFEEGTNYYGGFIQPGDSVVITYDAASLKKTLLFSGKGKEKFTITDSILQLREIFNSESEKIKKLPFPADYLFNKIDSLQNKLTRRLISYRSLMSKESFNQLNAFIKANVLRAKYNGVTAAFGTAYDNILKKHSLNLHLHQKKHFKTFSALMAVYHTLIFTQATLPAFFQFTMRKT